MATTGTDPTLTLAVATTATDITLTLAVAPTADDGALAPRLHVEPRTATRADGAAIPL